jgi:hypothetical protein
VPKSPYLRTAKSKVWLILSKIIFSRFNNDTVMRVLTFLLALLIGFGSTNTFAAPQNEDKMVAVVLLMDDGDDKKVVTTIFTTLMAAEKVAKTLNIEMTAADGPVENDVFVFALKSEDQKELTLKMFDEEGYEPAAGRTLKLENGNNYNALNVSSLEDGTYEFVLENAEGEVYNRKVTINRAGGK